jgi:hypothetical protein
MAGGQRISRAQPNQFRLNANRFERRNRRPLQNRPLDPTKQPADRRI